MSDSILCKDATLVLPDRLLEGDLWLQNGKISAIGEIPSPPPHTRILNYPNAYILPGFVETHNHGTMGFDFSFGLFDPEREVFQQEADLFQRGLDLAFSDYILQGITSILPTTLAAPLEVLERALILLNQYLNKNPNGIAGMVPGLHIEGTFLKLPQYAGAQNPAHFQLPDPEIFERLQDASGQRIKMVVLPPEHGEAGLALSRSLIQKDIRVAAGHSGATAEEVYAAVEAGLSLGIHFLNGPNYSSYKPFSGGGALQAMLRSDEMNLELICDGYHVHPSYVRDVIARKGLERVHIITDSVFANGRADIQEFDLAGNLGARSANGQYLQVKGRPGTLFGSVLRMDKAFENVLNWLTTEMQGVWHRQHPALSLAEALVQTSRMASGNPARWLGLEDRGEIGIGKRADLVIANMDETEEGFALKLEAVFLDGEHTDLASP